jgi:thymidine phosphorylase
MNADQQIVQSEFSAVVAFCACRFDISIKRRIKTMNRIALIALALLTTSTAASASEASRRDQIDARQAIQKYNIQRQRDRGELTWLEQAKLNYEQYRVRQMENYAKRDGYVSAYEARRINDALNAAGRDIYRQSHDSQVTWWKRW